MPVVYSPAEPVSPQISGAYGAAQQFSQDLPTQARLAEATAAAAQRHTQTQLQASEAAAHLNLQQQALAQQGATAREALGERARESDAGRDLQAAQFGAQLQQQPMLQQQAAQLQAWLSQQRLSQAEQVHYQQLQNSIGTIMSDPSLENDPETRNALLFKVKTGLDQYAPRIEAAKAQAVKEMAEAARNRAIETKTLHDFLAQNPDARIASRQLPDGTWMHRYVGEDGKVVTQFSDPQKGGKDDAAKLSLQETEKARKEYSDAFAKAAQIVHQMRGLKTREGTGPDAKESLRHPELENERDRLAMTDQIAARILGYDPSLPLPRMGEHIQRHLQRAGVGGNVATPQGAQGGNVATPPGASPRAEQLQWKPFKVGDPATMNDGQKLYASQNKAEIESFRERPDLSKSVREGAVTALEESRKLMERYGSVERMRAESPTDFEAWQLMKQFLKALPPAPPPPPARGPRKGTLEHFTGPSLSS